MKGNQQHLGEQREAVKPHPAAAAARGLKGVIHATIKQ
jgi:hypothetical protein